MESDSLNPYAAPASLGALMEPGSEIRYFRDGAFLAVKDGAELPAICLLTNAPAEGSWRKRVKIAWTPPWVFLLLLVNILVLLVVMIIVQKKAGITYSLSAAARAKIVRRRIIASILLLSCAGLFVFSVTVSDSSEIGPLIAGLMAVVCLITSLVLFTIANPVKVVKFKNGWFRIKGCSRDFLDTLPTAGSPF